MTVFATSPRKPSMDYIPLTDLVLSASLLRATTSHPYESMYGMWTVCTIAPSAENAKLMKQTAGMLIIGRMSKPYLRTCFFLVSHTLPALKRDVPGVSIGNQST